MLSWCHPSSDYPFNPWWANVAVQVAGAIPLFRILAIPAGNMLEYPVLDNGGHSEEILLSCIQGFVSSSQVHSTTTLVPVSIASGSLEPGGVVYSSCSLLSYILLCCKEYTWVHMVCQVPAGRYRAFQSWRLGSPPPQIMWEEQVVAEPARRARPPLVPLGGGGWSSQI